MHSEHVVGSKNTQENKIGFLIVVIVILDLTP